MFKAQKWLSKRSRNHGGTIRSLLFVLVISLSHVSTSDSEIKFT